MSTKQRLVAAIQALPESPTLEEAVASVYAAFKAKQRLTGVDGSLREQQLQPLPVLECRVPEGWKDAIYE
jgi:hypothetical protein